MNQPIEVTESQAREAIEGMKVVSKEPWYQDLRELAQEYQWRIALGMAITGSCAALAIVALASMLPEAAKEQPIIEWLVRVPAFIWFLAVTAFGVFTFLWFYSMFREFEDTIKAAQQRWFVRFIEENARVGVRLSPGLLRDLASVPTMNPRVDCAAALWHRHPDAA